MTPSRARQLFVLKGHRSTGHRSTSLGPADPISRLVAVTVGRLTRHLPALEHFRKTIEKVVRFGGVGIASSILYALAVTVATSFLGIRPDVSALLAYSIAVPFNFLLHRHFTFRSGGGVGGDVTRYASAQVVGVVVSYAAMAVSVDLFGLPYACGIVAALALVPILTYLLLNNWVFAGEAV